MQLGLERIEALLASLGEPQARLPAIVVAGTNGKGSVTAFASAILRAAGLRTGTFYSPHLFRVNERIRVDGDEIPSPELDRIALLLRERHAATPFTFFEGLTAAAALWFYRRGVEAAVYEVGLGGRLDATRSAAARVTVITGISIDHREHLGRTRTAILREKLGITRRGVPLVANLPDASLERAAARHCEAGGIPLHCVGREVALEAAREADGGMSVALATPVRDYGALRLGLSGLVQAANAATAVRAVEEFLPGSRSPSHEAVRRGLEAAVFPGRFQILTGYPRVILDVAHNEEALLAALGSLRGLSPPRRTVLLFGVLARKELGRFPGRALRAAREVILAPLKDAGAARGDDLLRRFARERAGSAAGRVRPVRGMGEGLRLARRILREDDTLLVLGSHHAVAEAVGYM